MDRREVEEIEAFLNQVGQPSLLAYYGLSATSADADKEAAIKKRRAWAQGQQANPKYKAEAMFLIKNNGLIRRVLVDDFDAYRANLLASEMPEKIDELISFLSSSLGTSTVLTPQAEAATKLRGRQLGLSENALDQKINEALDRLGITRGPSTAVDELPLSARAIDYYEVLHAPPTASTADLELAYRARYRWARNLKDLKRSSEFLSQLDEAWRVLQNPERRAQYDELRTEAIEITDEVERAAAQALRDRMREFEAVDPAAEPPPPFAMSLPEAPPTAAATAEPESPPAPRIAGRTLGLADGPQPLRERAPRLSVAGALNVVVNVGMRPVEHKLLVQNLGQGRMFGRVASDVPWLVPRPAQLEPNAREQFITVEVRPKNMPKRQGHGVVTVVADHGERRVVNFDVTRGGGVLGYVIFAGLFLAAAAAVVLVGQALLPKRGASTAAPTVTLEIAPVAGRVTVDGKDAGTGTTVALHPTGPNTTLNVRVEAEHFAPYQASLTVGTAPTRAVVPLKLADPWLWTGAPEGTAAPVTPDAEQAILALAPELARCLPAGTPAQTLRATVWVASTGTIGRAELADLQGPTQAARGCLEGVFWGAKLRPVVGGDYQKLVVDIPVAPS